MSGPDPRSRPAAYIASLAWRYPSLTLQSAVLLLLMAAVNLPLPLLNKLAVDYAIPAGDTIPLILLGIFAFAVRALASAFQIFQNFVVWKLMASLGHQLRVGMVSSLVRAPYGRTVSGELGSYLGRLTTDVNAIEEMILDTFRFILRPIVMIAVMVAVMAMISIPVTILLLIVTPTAVFCIRHLAQGLYDRQDAILEQRQQLQAGVTEILDNIRLLRSYTQEERYRGRILGQTREFTDAAVGYATHRQFVQGLIDLLNLLPWIVLVAVGSWMIDRGDITLGDFLLFVSFDQLMRSPLGQLGYYILHIRGEMAAPARVQEVIELEPEAHLDHQIEQLPERLRGDIRLTNIDFAYAGREPIFNSFSMDIKAGERLAIVGASGAGKSSLFHLLLGFWRPDAGSIHFDGRSSEELGYHYLRNQFGVVFQDNRLFDASLRENLCLHGDLPDARIWQALTDADCAAFVKRLPNGLDTEIGVRGLKLSGGQRQRLAIARALLQDPAIILLDEATSSLDSVSEQQIQQALERLLEGRTSITIAHRLSTIVNADRIIVMEKGSIAESGNHQELLQLGGIYADLYQAQVAGLLPDDA